MKRVLNLILPLAILSIGVLVLGALLTTRPEAAKKTREVKATLVETVAARAVTEPAVVRAQGSVIAAREMVVVPEVTGKVVEMSDNLVAGGKLSEGDTLLKINPRDYRLRLQQQAAQVEGARFNSDVEKSRRKIAEREWELLGESIPSDESGKALALRRPHERNARAGVTSANSGLALARLNLDRTTIQAPFNALVLNESVDIGQVVGPGSRAATLVGTDHFWVRVSVPVSDLEYIKLPTQGAEGSLATVYQDAGAATTSREGKTIRLLGDVDPAGRMARLLVEVADPLGLQTPTKAGLPLLLGAFVRVEFKGKTITGTVSISRQALREGDKVWILKDGKLQIRQVEVAYRQRETVLVRGGLSEGEEVITSRVDTPVEGMAVRTVSEGSK